MILIICKIFTKILVGKLALILIKILTLYQHGFIKGRSMYANIMATVMFLYTKMALMRTYAL